MKKITVVEVEYIAFKLAREKLSYNEPIPDFKTRFPNVLESCVAVPFQTFSKKSLYPGFFTKASILFYLMVKNHPFQNGNKRIAISALFVFMHKNKKWIKIDAVELYNFTIWITSSPSLLKNETLKAIEKFLKEHSIDLE